nr:ribonuclease H-like domain-containing protein [Tanacetum cinerariifolium]
MASLRYRDEHNKVGYLLKPTGSDDYHQIIDFLRASHIRYALTHDPIIFDSLVKQFWPTTTLRSPELGPLAIQATIDKTPYTITEDLVKSQLQLADDGGIDDLPIAEIYSGMDNLGSWDQFGSPLAVALICLSDGRQFNWSSYIFKGMVSNIRNAKKFLMYSRFLQTVLGEGAGVAVQAVSQHIPAHDQPQDHLSAPPRQPTSDLNAPVFEHGQSSDPNIASFSRTHETDDGPFTNVEDLPLGVSFYMSPPRSTQAPPTVQTSGGAEDLITLTTLSSVVSTLMQKQDVDLDALLALDNAAVTADSNISPGGASDNLVASTNVPADVPTSVNVPTDVPTSVVLLVFQTKERLQWWKKTLLSKKGHLSRCKRIDLVEANKSLSKTLLGDDVSEDNFPARMAALIKRKKQALAEKLAKERKEEFENIQKTISNIQIQSFSKSLKRTGPVLEEPSSKRQKSTEAPVSSVPEVPQSPVVSSPKSSSIRRKSLGRKRLPQPKSKLKELDLDADAQTFIKVVSNEDSEDEAPLLWSALVGWEVITTPLGDINALYRIDRSTKHFTTLRQILYMVDRQDLVLFASHEGGKGSFVWKHQHLWQIRSWRLYTLSNVYVLDTVSGEVVYMFAYVPYPLLVKHMETMLTHKLEIDKDVVGNDMTTAEQLIQFIKNQLVAAQHADAVFSRDISLICADFSSILVKTQSSRYVVPTGKVVVPTGRYVVPADEHIAVQRESKARTTLLQSIPNDHVADFHYMDDARDIWNAVKARFGGNAESKKMRKSMLKQEFLEFRIGEAEGLHKGYVKMQKILSGLELLSFDDLYYKLKTLEVDVKGYTTFSSSQSVGPSHYAFVSTTSASKKMSYGDSPSYSLTTTYTAPSNSKTWSYRSEKLDLEEMDLKWQMAMLSVRVHKFEQKAGQKIGFDKKESARFNKKKVRCYKCQQRGHFARECREKGGNDKQRYSSFKNKEIRKKKKDSKAMITVDMLDAIEEGAAKIYNLINGANTEEACTAGDAREFALMGVTSERISSKNLFRLIDSSMSTRIKVSLGFNNYIRENELGWDDSTFSVFTTNSEDVEGRPLFNSDKSSEVNTNDFASSDSSVKSSEPKTNDSTSCASTSSVSTSENEAEIESNVGTPIQEPIIVQDLPSFSCNSSDKNENTSRTSCNKNGYFNKKACHFRKHDSSVSNLCFVNHQNQFVPQAVLLRTGKVNIPPTRPQPVPTDVKDEEVFDSGCSRSMNGNKERLDDFQVFQGGKVTLRDGEGRITRKGTIRTPTLDFENVYYVKEQQQFNLFSISQICDKKNRVLFTNT